MQKTKPAGNRSDIADYRSVITAREWLSSQASVQQYRAWCDNPITKIVVNILRNELRPTHFHAETPDKDKMALIDNGRMEAGHFMLDRLLNLDIQQQVVAHHVEDTRVVAALQKHGYSIDEARRIIATYQDMEPQDLEGAQQLTNTRRP